MIAISFSFSARSLSSLSRFSLAFYSASVVSFSRSIERRAASFSRFARLWASFSLAFCSAAAVYLSRFACLACDSLIARSFIYSASLSLRSFSACSFRA
jgi:hypothetical protein